MESFELVLDINASQPFHRVAEIFNEKHSLVNYKLEETKVIVFSINLSPKDVFFLGSLYCHVSFNWNRKIQERIKQRDELTLWGKKYFEGTEDEKVQSNNYDRQLLAKFPNGYFESFVKNVLHSNILQKTPQKESTTFETSLNFPELILIAVKEFNDEFGGDFQVVNVYDNDGLDFAELKYVNGNLIDVFCLGYTVTLKEEKKFEEYRRRNLTK